MPELAAHLERVAKLAEQLKLTPICEYEAFLAAALAACARETMTRWRDQWRKEALEMVDPHYAKRGLHQKYLKLDNMAAGIDACADDLEDWLAALERAVGEKAT